MLTELFEFGDLTAGQGMVPRVRVVGLPAGASAESVPRWIAEQVAVLQGPMPDVPIEPHCTTPYECPFVARFWPTLPPRQVSTLYAMRRRALELDEQGYRTIHDLPEDVPLGKIAERHRRAVQEGRIVVEPTLAGALDVFVPPIAIIDFETVGLAIPVWSGCHPYNSVPVQFRCAMCKGRMAASLTTNGSPTGPKIRGWRSERSVASTNRVFGEASPGRLA